VSSYLEETLLPYLRLRLLQVLSEADGYEAHERGLSIALDAFGLPVSGERLRAALHWLEDAGLVTLGHVGESVVAHLSEAGDDVARGRARVAGVERPRPGRQAG